MNEKKKDEEFIDQIEKTQQRSNLTPLQPENKEREFLKLGVNKDYRTSFAGAKFATACLP